MTVVDAPLQTPVRSTAELVEAVLEVGAPIDRWGVAATLESQGVRDVDAHLYGKRDVFELADEVHALALARGVCPTEAAPAPPWRPRARRFAGSYLRGAFFFVPLAIQLASLLVLGYSQWASLSFTVAQASVIALVIGLSFVATAGTVQALGYLGPYFSAPGKHMVTERVTYVLLALGLLVAVAVGGVVALLNVFTDAVAWPRFGTGVVYYVLMSALWLSTAVLYMLRRYWGMVAGTVAGIAVVGLVHDLAGAGIYVAHWLGISATVALNLAWAGLVLRRRARATRGLLRQARVPRRSVLVRMVGPYFVYGTLYFSFLFADRAVGWSAGSDPLPIWFRTPYELGLDWALVSVVLGMAFLEYLVTAFAVMSDAEQERWSALRIGAHNRSHVGYYLRHLGVVVLLLGGGAVAGWWGLPALAELGPFHELRAVLADPVTRSVFGWGVAGYALLTCALTNATFLLGLSRPWPVIRALVPALIADLVVGIALSRSGEYWHSVVGLTVGAGLFFVLTARAAVLALREADYAAYSSY